MTTHATPPMARAHHVPEALYSLVAGLGVIGANAAAAGIAWWKVTETGSTELMWLAGAVGVLLVLVSASTLFRHSRARHTVVGAIGISLLADALLAGYVLSNMS